MQVSTSWLQAYTPIDQSPAALADALTMAGLEVDACVDRFAFLETVKVGRIQEIQKHPQADRLSVCQVDIGSERLSIVCGAPNVKTGMLSACALPGTQMPDGTVISESTVRGQVSQGMLCAAAELALGSDTEGIMDLDAKLPVGLALNEALALRDFVYELDLTPNRADCFSILGVAREVAAMHQRKVVPPKPALPTASGSIHDLARVEILDPALCHRYAARMVVDVQVAPSPDWLQDRLLSVGLKPINNIVDVTNFVMMETGQPLHAFDFDQLADQRIVVRAAGNDRAFTTLDGKNRELSPEMLLICDGQKPVALAGVMGGENSEIEDATRRVLIEGAYFNPVSVRKTAKKLGLSTDASHRFERGVDPAGTVAAIERAAALIADLGKGQLIDGVIDEHPRAHTPIQIECRVARLNHRLGTALTADEIAAYLQSIEFDVRKTDADHLMVQPPSYRVDIHRFEDLTEEVARLFGYDRIETVFPKMPSLAAAPNPDRTARERVRDLLCGMGFAEAINYSFVHAESCDRLQLKADDIRRQHLHLLNPLSEEQSVMRTSLMPGLLEAMKLNLDNQNRDLRLFEVGNIFLAPEGQDVLPEEQTWLAALWCGSGEDPATAAQTRTCDFYDIKGAVESLGRGLGLPALHFSACPSDQCTFTRPGHSANVHVGDRLLGLIGELHPDVLRAYGIKQTGFVFQIDMATLVAHLPKTQRYVPLPRFPSVTRDVTLIVDRNVEAMRILEQADAAQNDFVEQVVLVDVYEGAPIAAGKKSVSFRITYRSESATLEDSAVNRIHTELSAGLISAFNAELPA